MANKVMPTFRLSRKWKKLRIVNKAKVATKSIPILNLILCEFSTIVFSSELNMIQALMNHGTPNDNRMAKELAPNELDTPIPLSPALKKLLVVSHYTSYNLPFLTEIALLTASGVAEPAAKNVKPMTMSGQ